MLCAFLFKCMAFSDYAHPLHKGMHMRDAHNEGPYVRDAPSHLFLPTQPPALCIRTCQRVGLCIPSGIVEAASAYVYVFGHIRAYAEQPLVQSPVASAM